MSNLVKWLGMLYPGFAVYYEMHDRSIPDALAHMDCNVPEGITSRAYTFDVMLERIPLRASIWDLKPKSTLATRLSDMINESLDPDDDSFVPIVSLICSDSSLAGKDSLFLVVANPIDDENAVDYIFTQLPADWYSDHNTVPRFMSGSTTYVDPDGNKRRMAVLALQLSSYKK